MEAYRNTVGGIPASSYSSPSSVLSTIAPTITPSSGSASTSVLPASKSIFFSISSSSSAPLTHASLSRTSANTFAPVNRLCSLTEWSEQHIRSIFEAETDQDALQAIQNTFSESLSASINGAALSREGIDTLVLAMRGGCGGSNSSEDAANRQRSRLQVQWKHGVEVPRDPSTNREGSFGGVYVIKGIRRVVPGTQKPVEFERHKTVTVKIESMSSELDVDSRRITSLVFVASDVRVDRQAAL
ncbi:hypothetical protein AX17_006432 [Amanita inopinata Kibby_2008]|nr:hypothetical protein AX17_006432 [Amanita inopinata Kibby_2008]